MWDKLSFFSWSKKKPTVQAVQREVSVTLTNGDRRETIQRSPSGTKLASSSSAKHGLDDDNSSEASTSLNFGFKAGSSPRRNSSFSFSREPLDLPTWSNVTSPGFTSRLVQQASGNSPLKEFNDSLSHSPFRKSPYKDLRLGELPYPGYNTFSRKPTAHIFPSPQRAPSLRSGVSSSVYNRDRRRNARQGQTFVRIAPIDPSVKANLSISRKSSSPPLGLNGGPYSPRGSPRAGNESYRQEGLGGIPQQELAMRFNRLWPSSPGGPVPGPGRPSSPTSPSNIMEALTAGRKRTRDQDTYYPPNATPPSVSPPSKISIGIGDTPVRQQVSKRVKFLGGPEGHDRPMMVGYSGIGAGDSEPLSSESILEQMNQTEKRFLPDSTSTPYSMQKKSIRMPGVDDQPSALHSALRKRRSQTSVMSAVEDEARGEKAGRFCTCNECYAEAAGMSSPDQSLRKDGSTSPRASDEKSTNTGDSRSKETCDKGVSTTEFDRGAYFREVFRKADKKKAAKDDDDDVDEMMPFGKTVITKEMYEKDKRKRIERYYRMLKMKPPGGNIFDPCPGESNPSTTSSSTITTSMNANESASASSTAVGTEGNNNNPPPYNFGSQPSTSSSGGFTFGKQTSPVSPTVTTSACSTITSPSSSAGFSMGSSSLSSTAPTSLSTNIPFGIGETKSTAITTVTDTTDSVTPSLGPSSNFASLTPAVQISFSAGSSPKATTTALVKPSEPAPATTSSTGGFNFSGTTPTLATAGITSSSSSSVPTFGIVTSTSTPAPDTSSSSNPGFAFKGFGNVSGGVATPPNTFGGGAATTSFGSGAPFGSSTNTTSGGTSNPPPVFGGTFGTLFGQTAAPTTTSAGSFGTSFLSTSAATPAKSGFSFGGNTASTQDSGESNSTTTSSTITSRNGNESAPASSTAVGTEGNNNPPPYNFGLPPSTSGGFTFGKQTSAPTVTTSAVSTITSPSSSTGFSLGSNNLSSTAPTASLSANTPFGFGGTISKADTTVTPSLGPSSSFVSPTPAAPISFSSGALSKPTTTLVKPSEPAPTTTSSSGGFNFSVSPPTPAAAGIPSSSSSVPTFGIGTTTSTPAPDTSSSSNPGFAFKGFGNVSSPNTFGGGAATTGFGSGVPFGSSANTTSGGPSNPPPVFGGGAATTGFGSGAPFGSSTNTSGGPSNPPVFGASFGTFGQAPAAPTTTSAGTFGTSFGSPPAATTLFGATAAPTTTSAGSFGTSFGTTPATPANSGFSFGGNTAPSQGSAGSAPFQFGQQAAQGVPGGFNFAASAPAPSPGGQPMFSMGSASTAPRRRDVRRRHR